jgi:hypothetical protein
MDGKNQEGIWLFSQLLAILSKNPTKKLATYPRGSVSNGTIENSYFFILPTDQ